VFPEQGGEHRLVANYLVYSDATNSLKLAAALASEPTRSTWVVVLLWIKVVMRYLYLVLAYQSAGEFLRFNPHFHCLVLEGGFEENGRFGET